MRPRGQVLSELREILGLTESFGTSTAGVLTSPSSISLKIAEDVVGLLPMEQLLQALGVIAAKAVGAELTSRALRPADYVLVEDLPRIVVKRLMDDMRKRPEIFNTAFAQALRIQG